MSFQCQVPAVLTRLAPGELKAEWICRHDDGTFYWSDSDPHYTFETIEELEAVRAVHRGIPLAKEPQKPPTPTPKPKTERATSSPTPPREHWLLRWERNHDS